MCGRYTPGEMDTVDILHGILGQITDCFDKKDVSLWSREIYPTARAPVLTQQRKLMLSKWGFDRARGTGVIFNARSETLLQSNFWKRYLPSGRCVIPAKNYFEWEHVGKKAGDKYVFFRSPNQPLYLAGIMDVQSPSRPYAVITRCAAPNIRFVHDRMPLILTEEMLSAWLDPVLDSRLLTLESAPVECRRVE